MLCSAKQLVGTGSTVILEVTTFSGRFMHIQIYAELLHNFTIRFVLVFILLLSLLLILLLLLLLFTLLSLEMLCS